MQKTHVKPVHLSPYEWRCRLHELYGSKMLARIVTDPKKGSKIGPFGEVIACETGYGHWDPTDPMCSECPLSTECMCISLQVVPKAMNPTPKLQPLRSDPNPFPNTWKLMAQRVIFNHLAKRAHDSGQRKPFRMDVMDVHEHFERLDADMTPEFIASVLSVLSDGTRHNLSKLSFKFVIYNHVFSFDSEVLTFSGKSLRWAVKGLAMGKKTMEAIFGGKNI